MAVEMNAGITSHESWTIPLCVVAIAAGCVVLASGTVSIYTPDQKGFNAYEQGEFESAATLFADPMWKGVALFKQGEFEESAGLFAGFDTAESAFNRGNALVMLGRYEEAAESYSRALVLKPEWTDAINNREIALGRAAMLKQEGGDMTGGMMGADDIVFTTGEPPPSGGEEQTDGGEPMSDAEINAIWLRQVQTKPADFLAAKFAYQYATRTSTELTQEAPE
jgi:Ca-activated chloride channel family protein